MTVSSYLHQTQRHLLSMFSRTLISSVPILCIALTLIVVTQVSQADAPKLDLSLSAEDISSSSSSSNSSAAKATSNNPFDAMETGDTFLPVEEAYQLTVQREGEHLIAEWMIADEYFLYGEQFRFSTHGKQLESQREKGKISYDTIFEKDVEKYYGSIQSFIPINQLPQQETFTLDVVSQGCADAGLCYPPQTESFSINLSTNTITPIDAPSASTPELQTNDLPVTDTTFIEVLLVLGSALIGGLILNLMPCVFPVLSIKALSLANHTEKKQRIQHGWSYTLGCLATFVSVAIILLIVRGSGTAVGWGFQLQSPVVITSLAFLFFILGLSLSGFINIGHQWMNTGQSLTQGQGLSQSFFTGALSAVVASPCTAPFMASALGFALTQPTAIALLIFATLGFGMALPFLLLSYIPQLGRFLPKPGAWMETFKQALAFPLYLTSIWLLWVLGHQIDNNAVIWVIIGGLTVAFALWLIDKKPSWKPVIIGITVLSLIAIIWQNQTKPEKHDLWQPYSPEVLSQLRQQGQPVFVNLTADWCITCKINEKWVFTEETLQSMKAKGIHLLEGDWTNHNAEITELLTRYGRGGVPLYLLFPAEIGGKAKLLPQILNPISFKSEIDAI